MKGRGKWTGWKRWNEGEEVANGREELNRFKAEGTTYIRKKQRTGLQRVETKGRKQRMEGKSCNKKTDAMKRTSWQERKSRKNRTEDLSETTGFAKWTPLNERKRWTNKMKQWGGRNEQSRSKNERSDVGNRREDKTKGKSNKRNALDAIASGLALWDFENSFDATLLAFTWGVSARPWRYALETVASWMLCSWCYALSCHWNFQHALGVFYLPTLSLCLVLGRASTLLTLRPWLLMKHGALFFLLFVTHWIKTRSWCYVFGSGSDTLLMLSAEPRLGTVQDAVDATVHHNRDDTLL